MYTILRLNSDTSTVLREDDRQKALKAYDTALKAYNTALNKGDGDCFIGLFKGADLIMCNNSPTVNIQKG